MPYTRERKLEKRALGFCISCYKNKADEGASACAECKPKLVKHVRNSQKRRVALGLCIECKLPRGEGSSATLCGSCAEASRREYRAKVEAGTCVSRFCQSQTTVGLHCLHHWFAVTAGTYRMRAAGITVLKNLWEKQGGLCAITGEPLVPGGNASLDHIVPRSKGGTNDASNLQWVTLEANWLKRDRTLDEVYDLCERVLAHRSKRRANLKAV